MRVKDQIFIKSIFTLAQGSSVCPENLQKYWNQGFRTEWQVCQKTTNNSCLNSVPGNIHDVSLLGEKTQKKYLKNMNNQREDLCWLLLWDIKIPKNDHKKFLQRMTKRSYQTLKRSQMLCEHSLPRSR